MEGRTIEVCGVPDILPPDRTVDKLTIHFLRPKNGGGEVQRVIYPTSTKGQAFVVFELSEVATRVVSLKQTLDIGDEQFPLKIEIIDQSEVDLPVQATLDLRMFPEPSEVRQLLRAHKFKVSEQGSSPHLVLLEGTFLNLRAVRAQLQKQLQERERPTEHYANRNRPVSASDAFTAGAVPKDAYKTLPYVNGSHHGYISERSSTNISEAYSSSRTSSVSRSPIALDSSYGISDPSFSSHYHLRNGRHSRNPGHLLQDSGAPQSLPIFPSSTLTNKPPLPRGTLSAKEIILPVDADVFRYTWSFRKDLADTILKSHNVQYRPDENSGIISLTLKGGECEKAKEELDELFHKTYSSLCTHEIPLSGFGHTKRAQMGNQIQKLKDVYKVIVRQTENSIVIVGSSRDSYAVKQLVLGEPVDLPASGRTGRGTERGPRSHRSLSVPKHHKLRSDQDSTVKSEPPALSHTYSPANYQDGNRPGDSAVLTSRRRTSSESRERIEAQRHVPKAQPEPMSPSGGHQMPSTKKYALKAFSANAIKNKILNKSGKNVKH